MAIIEVDDDDFYEVLEAEFSTGNTVILKFGSEFCTSCFALETELEELDELRDDISILSIDCDTSMELVQKFYIQKLPTMLIYKDSQTSIYRGEGVVLCSDILQIIDEVN
jgi:thioredoxin-like negative regulator of GroEL